jgi:hypothetical protein
LQCIIDRLTHETLLLEPRARAAVEQCAVCCFDATFELFMQKVAKQRMVAVPAAARIQGHQEQICPIQPLQHRLCIILACHGRTKRRAEAPQESRLHQKSPHVVGLRLEHFIGQVIEHIGMAAAELHEKCRYVCGVVLLQR